MTDTNNHPQSGFAMVEAVLVLIIVGMIAGVGYWVATQRNTAKTPTSSATPVAQVAPIGTTTAIDQLTQQDAQAETVINSKEDSNDQASAQASNSALTNLGGAYNEATF